MTIASRVGIIAFAVLIAGSSVAQSTPKHDIRGAAIGMSLGEAMAALANSGAICGKGVFDTHRCDFDSDTFVHLHVVGPGKIVQSIQYVYPPFKDAHRAAVFKTKVAQVYQLTTVDKVSKFVTGEGYAFTIVDGEIDVESATNTSPMPDEPKL